MLLRKLQKAIKCVQSYRIPQQEKLPVGNVPRIYKAELIDTPPGSAIMKIHNIDLTSRTDRFTRAGKLCKHIREVLGIKRHLSGYSPWQRRSDYITMTPTSGRKAPHLSYREHATSVSRMVEAKLQYFKRKSYCYSGWSMEKGWDKIIKQGKPISKDGLPSDGAEQEKTKKVEGESMQAKLQHAADQLLSYEEEPVCWTPYPDVPTKAQMNRFRRPKLQKPVSSKSGKKSQIGQINWSPVRNLQVADLQVTSVVDSGGSEVVGGVSLKNSKQQALREHAGQTKEGESHQSEKNVPAKEEDESSRSARAVTSKPAKDKVKRLEEKRTQGGVPPYRVKAIFHWQKMDPSTGYPPLRLDRHVKCGYYSVPVKDK